MNSKNTLSLSIAIAGLLSGGAAQTNAQLSDLVGYAKTLYSNVTGFIGTTTVTPAYALKMWRHSCYGYYRDMYLCSHFYVGRSMITGAYFYSYRNLLWDGSWYVDNTPFPVDYVARLSYYCDVSDYSSADLDGHVIKYIWSDLKDFDIAVWASSVVKTGYLPPSQPYSAWLKSDATRLASTCDPVDPYTRETRKGVSIRDTGYSTVKMGLVNYEYTWPMLCWVGDCYDY